MKTTTPSLTLSAAESIALEKVKGAGTRPCAGTHTIDTVIHIQGEIKVSEDTSKIPTVSIPLKEVLALFIARSGFTREGSMEIIKDAMKIALEKSPKGQGAIEAAKDIDTAWKDMVSAGLADLPKTAVKGRVDAKGLTVTKVA